MHCVASAVNSMTSREQWAHFVIERLIDDNNNHLHDILSLVLNYYITYMD